MKNISILFLLLFTLYSCSENTSEREVIAEGEEIPVRVRLTMTPIAALNGKPAVRSAVDANTDALSVDWTENNSTRTGMEPMTEAETTIHRAWLLQFSGTSVNSRLLKKSHNQIIDGYASFTLTNVNATCRVYIIANVDEATVNSFTTATTLAAFEATVFPITNGYMTPEQVSTLGLPACAVQDLDPRNELPAAFELRSRLSRLTLSYTQVEHALFDERSAPIETSVSLANLPNGFVFCKSPTSLTTSQQPALVTYKDSLQLDVPDGWNNASVAPVTVYVAENLAGQNTSVATKTDRGRDNAPDNSLHLKIAVKEMIKTRNTDINEDNTIENIYGYSVYLGDLAASMGDFNVEGNRAYTVMAGVKGKNNADKRLSVDVSILGYQNLSKLGTANCYIIPNVRPGRALGYYLDATVKGEGVSNSGFTATALSPVSAKVVWETRNSTAMTEGEFIDNSTEANQKVRIVTKGSKKYLVFGVKNYGNAVIAIYGSSNATGAALWSWHIWAPEDQPVGVGLKGIAGTLNSTDNSIRMMDMNLGALKKSGLDAAKCMLYQWGRKDPFLGGSTPTASGDRNIMMYAGVMQTTSSSGVSVSTGVANPEVLYSRGGDWVYPANVKLWGATTGSIVTIGGLKYYNVECVKTIYDPCPLGWRVPPVYAFTNVTTACPWNSNDLGRDAKSITTGTDDFWLPASGTWNNNGSNALLINVGVQGDYWTSGTNANVGAAAYGSSFTFNLSNIFYASAAYRANGCAVRCAQVK